MRAIALALVLAFAATAGAALAAPPTSSDKALAKEAYDRGTKAHEQGDYERAAREFARADALAPSPVALQAALDAAVEASATLLAAELLERSKRATATGALAKSIEDARALGARAGHVHVVCPAGATCTATIDGAPLADGAKGAWVLVGPHALVTQLDGAADSRSVEVRGGEDTEVVLVRGAAPRAAPSTPEVSRAPANPGPSGPSEGAAGHDAQHSGRKPLRPYVVLASAGVTLVFAGTATAFALAAKSNHDDFTSAGCDRANGSSCSGLKSDGELTQTVANIGFVATGVAGAATVLIAAFFTDWDGAPKSATRWGITPIARGGALSYGARF